jgi:hypothetical protein
MGLLTGSRNALIPCATLALLSACGGVSQFAATPSPDGLSAFAPEFHIENDVLYISSAQENEVYMYTYPKDKPIKVLTAFDSPQGLCSDKDGNVWVADPGYGNLLKYVHAGTKIAATLNDYGEYPINCSVDERSGDLAVANLNTASGNAGSISIYRHAKGNPTIIPAFPKTYYTAYDGKGNLFVDGLDGSAFVLGEVPMGRKAVVQLTISGATLHMPGGMQYANSGLAIGDQVGSVIYQTKITGSTATVTGSTPLIGYPNMSSDVLEFVILKTHRVVCVDGINKDIEIFNYPAGGNPIRHFNADWGTGATPSGFALSVPSPTPSP